MSHTDVYYRVTRNWVQRRLNHFAIIKGPKLREPKEILGSFVALDEK